MRAVLDRLRQDRFFQILLAALVLFGVTAPGRIASYPSLVDWPTIAALAGLLALTKGLELSGVMDRLGRGLIVRMATERAAALSLVVVAALLSTVLTNDVALFVVVPLTLGACRITSMPATRLIVLEALAVNTGSTLTPIGNPQNLFLWQFAHVPFAAFVLAMLPLVVALMVVLLVLTACVFSNLPIQLRRTEQAVPLRRGLLGVSLVLYGPFIVAADLHHVAWALAVVMLVFLVAYRRVVAQADLGLLLVFVLMFVDLRLLAGLGWVRDGMRSLGLDQPSHLYLTGIAASQVISNVPAAIALVAYSTDWRVIAYGVNIGGFGFMVGSLANLIALRMADDRRAWRTFHAYAIPFLVIAALLGGGLLFRNQQP